MNHTMLHVTVAFVLAAALVAINHRRYARRMHLVEDEMGNESLVVEATIGGLRTLFMIDTAYGGAPVLSTSFLSVQNRCGRGGGNVHSHARRCLHELRTNVTDDDRSTAVSSELLARTNCRAFTAGCTMRLMGIGETSENQSDMLLCPSIRIDGARDVDPVQADILVSNPLRGTPHILTMDYLLHRAPCTLYMRRGVLTFYDTSGAFHPLAATMMGGSFVVPMTVGGASMNVVLDTGSSATLSVSSTSLARIATCGTETPAKKVRQRGVNGEEVCSDILLAEVVIGPLSVGTIPILANDTPVQGSDGYAGMGLLRAFDMRFEPNRVGVRHSGLPVRAPRGHSPGTCGNALPSCAARRR